jgi:hypothetical protein
MPPIVRSRRFGRSILKSFAVAAVLIAASLAPRVAIAGCEEDAAGMCERPIACTPPQGGKCTTVAIPQPLTGHKFECRCLATKTTGLISRAPVGVGAVNGGSVNGGACPQQCGIMRTQCERHAANAGQRNSCAAQALHCCTGEH